MISGIFLLILGSAVCGHNKGEWKSRAIYQLLTDRFARSNNDRSPCNNLGDYCGGTHRGIIDNLNYIKDMGFDAIWITPVVDNTEHSYHGYHARNWEKINDHFGSENDLRELVKVCHENGIWVMVDVVANHVGQVGTDYSQIYPFNRAEHYHDYCDIRQQDWENDQSRVENCRLASLPDLKQENQWVQETLYAWIHNLVSNYNFDGVRVDTTPLVPKWFWYKFKESAGAFTMGEVFNGRMWYLKEYIGPLDSVLNYGIFSTLREVFKGKSFLALVEVINNLEKTFGDELDYMGVFGDNHDNARFLHGYGNWDNLVGMLIFTLFYRGIPIVYYGDEQGFGGGDDPANREPIWANMNQDTTIYKVLRKAIMVRKQQQIWNYGYRDIWHKDYMLLFSRGPTLVVVTNQNRQVEEDIIGVPFPDGTKFCDALTDYTDCIVINGGKTHLSVGSNISKIYVRKN